MEKQVRSSWLGSLIITCITTAALLSCSDEGTSMPEIVITEEGVSEIVGASLSEEDGGFAADVDVLLEETEEQCGYVADDLVTNEATVGVRHYEIEYELYLEVMCDESEKLEFVDYMFTANKSADLIRLDAEDAIVSVWTFANEENKYTLEGTYSSVGTKEFKVRDENTVVSDFKYSSEDLVVNEEGDFLGGALSLNYKITSTGGESKSASGSVTVTGTNVAVLDVSGFEYLYEIDLKTGDVNQIER